MEKNRDIKKALEELEQVSGDEKIQRIAELREKAIRDEHAALAYATDKRTRARKNRAEGQNGRNAEKIEIARNMLNKQMPIELIEEVTGLSKEEIEKLEK